MSTIIRQWGEAQEIIKNDIAEKSLGLDKPEFDSIVFVNKYT